MSVSVAEETDPAIGRWADERVPLDALCDPATELVDPRKTPDREFTYVDISSVDNQAKRIATPARILGRDAPSRARQVIRTGDVLVATTRPNLNAVALVGPEFDGQVASSGFCVLRPRNGLRSDYLFLWVQSREFVVSLSDLVQGALYPAVNDSQVRAQRIPWVEPDDQRQIAERLNAQLAAAARARVEVETQVDGAEGLMNAAIRAEFERAAVTEAATINLGNVCRISTGSTPARANPAFFGSVIPWVTPGDFDGSVHLSNGRQGLSELGVKTGRGRVFPAGAVLLVCIGATLGKVAIAGRNLSANQQINALICSDRLQPEFLYFWLRSLRATIREDGASATLPIINQERLGAYLMPLPFLDLQRAATDRLLALDRSAKSLLTILRARLADLDRLPVALLRAAFAE